MNVEITLGLMDLIDTALSECRCAGPMCPDYIDDPDDYCNRVTAGQGWDKCRLGWLYRLTHEEEVSHKHAVAWVEE